MSYCGHRPGFCGKRADCADTLCEGHPGQAETEPMDIRPVPDALDAIEAAERRLGAAVLTVAFLLLIALAAFCGVPLKFPFN